MKPRVAVVHPGLVPGGGSEACAMWTAQALRPDHEVTLITTGRPDLDALDRSCGTALAGTGLEVRAVAAPPGTRTRFDALRGFRLARYCRRHAHEFEVMISTYNVMDFGRPGIQRIADFSFDDALRRELHAGSAAAGGLGRRASPARSLYLGLARALAGGARDGWRRNRTVANSEWTRRLFEERFGLTASVVYPPVAAAPAPTGPWRDREDGFVFMGRLVPEKGLDLVVDILARVRETRPVHLHVLGREVRPAYTRAVRDLRRRHGDWIRLEGAVYGEAKAAFLSGHKYGLSGCRNEAFGLAVAEMVKAGAVVWVPDGGGQTEIVAHPDLVYRDAAGAAASIRAALASPERTAALRDHLAGRAAVFSTDRFAAGMREAVADFLKDAHARA
ncbi:MAG: glycosyltransferase family 4 protein [Acidobacteria bacterium]|nr:glycosyltransferase family 4 protein [Acidobacteriota bacterium]